MANNFDKYIGEPVDFVRQEVEKQGFKVVVLKSSKPKIKTDSELVVAVKHLHDKELMLIVGDFLINVGEDNGMV